MSLKDNLNNNGNLKATEILPEASNIIRDSSDVYKDELRYSLTRGIRYIEQLNTGASHIEAFFFTAPNVQEYKFSTSGLFSDVRLEMTLGSEPYLLDKTGYYKGTYAGIPVSYCVQDNRMILNPIPMNKYRIFYNINRTCTVDNLENYIFDGNIFYDILLYSTLFYFYTNYKQDTDMASMYGALMKDQENKLVRYYAMNECSQNIIPSAYLQGLNGE